MFYLACLIFLLAGHSGLSVVIGTTSWGVAQQGGGSSRGAGAQVEVEVEAHVE
jgi:hypothetical protein